MEEDLIMTDEEVRNLWSSEIFYNIERTLDGLKTIDPHLDKLPIEDLVDLYGQLKILNEIGIFKKIEDILSKKDILSYLHEYQHKEHKKCTNKKNLTLTNS